MLKNKKKTFKAESVLQGTGNVFKDLGFKDPEGLKAKANLAMEIIKVIKDRNLSQLEAAKIIKSSQPDISKLKSGQLAGFTIDRLVSFLILLDNNIEIRVSKVKKGTKGRLETMVE